MTYHFDYAWHMKDLMKATLAMLEMDRKDTEKRPSAELPKRQSSGEADA